MKSGVDAKPLSTEFGLLRWIRILIKFPTKRIPQNFLYKRGFFYSINHRCLFKAFTFLNECKMHSYLQYLVCDINSPIPQYSNPQFLLYKYLFICCCFLDWNHPTFSKSSGGIKISDAGTGGPLTPQYLADQLTLLQLGRADYPHLLLLAPPRFFTFRHHWYLGT